MGWKDKWNEWFGGSSQGKGPEEEPSYFDGFLVDKDGYLISSLGRESYEELNRQYYSGHVKIESSKYLEKPAVTEFADPNRIEGIRVSDRDIEQPDRFWGQHKFSGPENRQTTKEDFLELASHIPEVKAQLEQGVSLDELRGDPKLGACALLYFDPGHMPRVVKGEGCYELQGDGRHRVLAARELGFEMPVRITGEFQVEGKETVASQTIGKQEGKVAPAIGGTVEEDGLDIMENRTSTLAGGVGPVVDDGLGALNGGLGTVDDGLGTLNGGLGTVDDGLSTLNGGLGTLDDGLSTSGDGMTGSDGGNGQGVSSGDGQGASSDGNSAGASASNDSGYDGGQ